MSDSDSVNTIDETVSTKKYETSDEREKCFKQGNLLKELFRKRDVQQITPIAFSETNENQVTTVNPANVADKTRENGIKEKHGIISDSQVDQWKRIFPKLFNENNGSKSKDAKTIIIETNVIRSDQIEQITEIPESLFAGCKNLIRLEFENSFSKENLASVYKRVSSLPNSLFDDCHALESMNFSNNLLEEIPVDLFDKCTALKAIDFSNNKLFKIPDGLFKNCLALESMNFSNNHLWIDDDNDYLEAMGLGFFLFDKFCPLKAIDFSNNLFDEIQRGFFKTCTALESINFSKNLLGEIPVDLFDKCTALKAIDFSNNHKLNKIPDGLFKNCLVLEMVNFTNNQLENLPANLFNKCIALKAIDFSNNQLIKIGDGLFKNCLALESISFSNNLLKEIPIDLFDKCTALKAIDFSNNQLIKIADGLFKNCLALESIIFTNNDLYETPEGLFNQCTALKSINFSYNQFTKIPERLFTCYSDLLEIDFSANRIKTFHDNFLRRCAKLRSFNLEKNNIEAVSFRSLKPLSNCTDINVTDNFSYNSKSLYSSMFKNCFYKDQDFQKFLFTPHFKKYRNMDSDSDSKYYIVRNLDNNVVEKCFLAFYLSASSKTSESIKSLQSKFDLYKSKEEKSILSEFSLLDLFISAFGEINDFKIINLKKHIDQLILKDKNLRNIEFLIRSEKTIKNLCNRSISCHFETFFPNTFYELISRVRKNNTKNVDLKFEEESTFKSFCKYVAIERNPKKIIFHLIDYTDCFNIALKNKKPEIAKFVVIMLRYYVMVWSDFKNIVWTKDLTDSERAECAKKAQDALNRFNNNLFDSFEEIFENDMGEVITFLLDIKKLDLLNSGQNATDFLEYDLDRFNSRLPNENYYSSSDGYYCRCDHYNERKEFLQFARDNDDILRHESVKQIFTEKWHEKAAIKYYFDLLWFIVFVVFYTIYIESVGKSVANPIFQLSAWYISLVLAIVNLILEVFQCMMHFIVGKLAKYIKRWTNIFELVTFPLCIWALQSQENGDLKSSLLSLTILLSYIVLLTRLDKFPLIGGYVKVIGRIAKESISPFIVILILLCGFLEAFRNRSVSKGQENTSSFDTINNFNHSFEYNGFQMYAMMVGNLQIDDMGVDNLTGPNLITFFIFILFMFLITSLAFNIFTGIAINEIQSLIEDSNIQIMKDKIDYIYDGGYPISMFFDSYGGFRKFKKWFFRNVTKLYKIKWPVEKMITCCIECQQIFSDGAESKRWIHADSDLNQMDFVDDKYIENFETLECSAKNLEDRTKKLEDKLDLLLNNNKPENRTEPRDDERNKLLELNFEEKIKNVDFKLEDRTNKLKTKLYHRTKILEEKIDSFNNNISGNIINLELRLEQRTKNLEEKLNTILQHLIANK